MLDEHIANVRTHLQSENADLLKEEVTKLMDTVMKVTAQTSANQTTQEQKEEYE